MYLQVAYIFQFPLVTIQWILVFIFHIALVTIELAICTYLRSRTYPIAQQLHKLFHC